MPSSFIHTFALQRTLFRAYDIRGESHLFSNEFVTALSKVLFEQLIDSVAIKSEALIHSAGCHTNSHTNHSINHCNDPHSTIVIGYDPRHHSQDIALQFAKTFASQGWHVVWLGLVTTPIMVYWANNYDGHGIIATASHSAKHINGIKWVVGGESPSSEEIQNLYVRLTTLPQHQILNQIPAQTPSHILASDVLSHPNIKTLPKDTIFKDYLKGIDEAIHRTGLSQQNPTSPNLPAIHSAPYSLTIVVDCLNGATGLFAKSFFEHYSELCQQVIVINDEPNGDFPKGNPDPTESNRLTELQVAVLEHHADIGLAFDGDGDRLMVVDNQGNTVAPDHLIYLLACVAIDGVADRHYSNAYAIDNGESQDSDHLENSPTVNPASHHSCSDNSCTSTTSTHIASTNLASTNTVIFDVKCSHHLPQLIEQINATPQMSKTGSSIMRRALQNGNNQAIFAGELSGHFLFNDGYFILHDDAMYAAIRLIQWLCHQTANNTLLDDASFANDSPKTLSDIIAKLPVMVSTDDIYLSLDDYQSADSNETPLLNELTSLRQQLRFCCQSISQAHVDTAIRSYQNKETNQSVTILQCDKFDLPDNARLTCIDGIRLDFDKGFGVIRSSNTSNSLTVRFAGDTLADIQQVKRHFVNLCQSVNSQLAQQIASISLESYH